MKKILSLSALILIMYSCNKTSNSPVVVDPPANTALSLDDSTATLSMKSELSAMESSLDSMLATPHHTHQLYWDSIYHHHDSLFWHHHDLYHHEHYAHDDHHHDWTEYDPHVDHTHHHHHVYPGHEHDSLITVHNQHTHDNADHHFHGHEWHDHHVLDSLHEVHENHHP